MADIEHKDIPEADLHEPKGASVLNGGAGDVGKVYRSDGAGSGSWNTPLNGMDVATAGQVAKSDGAGDVIWESVGGNVFGDVGTFNGTATTPIPAGDIDDDLTYISMPGTGINTFTLSGGITFDDITGEYTLPIKGKYKVGFWGSFTLSNRNTAVAFKTVINQTIFSLRKAATSVNNTADTVNLSFSQYLDLDVGDKIGIGAAADGGLNIQVTDSGFQIELVEEAP